MIGLPKDIDWPKFTLEYRLLEQGQPYANFADTWQTDIDNAISKYPRIYLQLPRGHDKTERFAWWSLLWLNTTHAHRGYACGVDRDNAKLFRDASKKIRALHPSLFANIEVEKHVVYSKDTGSYIETISSDANSAYGLNFDLLIVNDFHAWPDKDFWEVLWTACEKKPNIRVWMESNALTLGTESFQWIAQFRDDFIRKIGVDGWKQETGEREWWHYIPDRFLAKWQEHALKNWETTLHPSTYRRLIQNQDCSDSESYVTPEQVEAVTTLSGPSNTLYSPGGRVVTAIDLGLKKDATAIASVQLMKDVNKKVNLKLLCLEVFTGTIDDPVLLTDVEQEVNRQRKLYSSQVIADPWNLQTLIQKYSWINEWTFSSQHVQQLTHHLYRVISDKQIELYPDAGLARHSDNKEWTLQKELIQAVLKQTSYGQRVDHRAGGYSDRLIAVGMCCHHLLAESGPPLLVERKKERKWQPQELLGSQVIDGWADTKGKLLRL